MIPADAKRIPLRPLALGEKTGHHHSLTTDGSIALDQACEMFEGAAKDGTKVFLRVKTEGVLLTHQEHKTHSIAQGEYEVTIQQENTDWGARPVED